MNTEKITYNKPEIQSIILDNEISLSMQSYPAEPDSGDEVSELLWIKNQDPYKNNLM